ncbi:hypothetical protein [Bacillus sp. KH172YL63]|uniref:hypothetical protein n=1 Tax=Bacillus sp. KH172YL63 TaxID=2709784 RepID=UPI0013E4B84E|nr:hypothetical protein [Bacillus sp. KH172YL63]BCB03456.1 hypothetical protein KH172YL63_15890 [Bacillus sp. KH172YL63]
MYNIENQEKLYYLSKIDELNQTIKRLQESYLYAEVQHFKKVASEKEAEIEISHEALECSEIIQEELIRDRNRFQTEKEKLEAEVNALHQKLHIKEELLLEQAGKMKHTEKDLVLKENECTHLSFSIENLQQEIKALTGELLLKNQSLQEKTDSIHALEKQLSHTEYELKLHADSLSELNARKNHLSGENKDLQKTKQTLLQEIHSLTTLTESQQQHITDLNAALSHSENTKKELFHTLLTKAEELEKLMAERQHTLDALEFSKNHLIEAEQEKLHYMKDFLSQFHQHIEENEWWLSSQFADIDQQRKKQDERIGDIEQSHELHFSLQKEDFAGKFKEVEDRFLSFIEEVENIRDHNAKLTHNLFELKRLVENQKRSQTRVINHRPKPQPESTIPIKQADD